MGHVGALPEPAWLICNSRANYKLNLTEYEHRNIKGLQNGSVAEPLPSRVRSEFDLCTGCGVNLKMNCF